MTFPQKGNKKVVCQQGDPLGKVCSKAGVRIKFDCKNGRCGKKTQQQHVQPCAEW